MFGSLCSVAEIAITLRVDAFHVNPVNVGTRRTQGFQDSTTEFGHSFVHFAPPPCASLVSPPSLGLSFMSRTSTSQLTCSENSDSIRQDIPRSDGGGQVSSIKYLIRFLYLTHYTGCSNRTRRVRFIHRSPSHEHSSPVYRFYHAFDCVSRVPSNVFWFKYEATVFHRLRSPQDEASLLGYICGPCPPTVPESLLSHCPWIVWPPPLPLSFHDRIKGDVRRHLL